LSTENQISLINNPQEFTRLYNAILKAEHGDDFLAIDDDRADRGNDGYLKSECRIYAGHCFKRVQNQSLDSEIRRKMVSDLKKAIALKKSEDWQITAWTFISNYPIVHDIVRDLYDMGREEGIDVAWRGPADLADLLQRHPHLRPRFPILQINHLKRKFQD